MKMRICAKCKIEKPLSCFSVVKNKAKANKDGVASRCKECRAEQNREWHNKNKQRSLENSRRWKDENKDRVKEYSIEYINSHKEECRQRTSDWNKLNKSRKAHNSSKKRAIELSATPKWLNPIQLAQIQEFYDIALAKSVQTGVKYHVDHIHPIQGKGYNGLHVPWNMQIIKASENIAKKNRNPAGDSHCFWEA